VLKSEAVKIKVAFLAERFEMLMSKLS